MRLKHRPQHECTSCDRICIYTHRGQDVNSVIFGNGKPFVWCCFYFHNYILRAKPQAASGSALPLWGLVEPSAWRTKTHLPQRVMWKTEGLIPRGGGCAKYIQGMFIANISSIWLLPSKWGHHRDSRNSTGLQQQTVKTTSHRAALARYYLISRRALLVSQTRTPPEPAETTCDHLILTQLLITIPSMCPTSHCLRGLVPQTSPHSRFLAQCLLWVILNFYCCSVELTFQWKEVRAETKSGGGHIVALLR